MMAQLSKANPHWRRLSRLTGLLVAFATGQGTLQIINLLGNLYLLRALSIDNYAQYSLALAFQNTAVSLTSLTLTDTIIPLVGPRTGDRMVVGRYVRAAQRVRTLLYLTVLPVCILSFLIVFGRHAWPRSNQLVLLTCVVLSLYFSIQVSCYSAPLIMARRLYTYYLAQTVPSALKLACYVVVAYARVLSAGVAAAIGTLSVLLSALMTRTRSADLMTLPSQSDPTARREIVALALPSLPASLFSAFQPQLALLLVSIFGQSTQIAEIGALSRIAQMFLILNTANALLVEPYVARLPPDRLASAYVRILSLAFALEATLVASSFVYPAPLLLLLGPHYADLGAMVPWVVLAASLSTFANLLWVMNRGRRWIFWRGSILEVACLTIFQVGYVWLVGVRSLETAVLFMLCGGAANLVAHAYITLYGFATHRYPLPQRARAI